MYIGREGEHIYPDGDDPFSYSQVGRLGKGVRCLFKASTWLYASCSSGYNVSSD